MASKNSKFNTPPSKSARPNTDKEASEALELSKAIDLVKIELRVFHNNLGKVRMKEDQLLQSAKRLKDAPRRGAGRSPLRPKFFVSSAPTPQARRGRRHPHVGGVAVLRLRGCGGPPALGSLSGSGHGANPPFLPLSRHKLTSTCCHIPHPKLHNI